MGSTISPPATGAGAPPPRARSRRRLWIGVGVLGGVVLLVLVTVVFLGFRAQLRGRPSFPLLTSTPDPSLHGTVAYLGEGNCIRIIAAGGGRSREVWCVPSQDVPKAEKLGKEQGPQLVWRPDGRLEVTMFRMTDPPGPNFNPGWQKIIDVGTGKVEDVPAAEVPSAANRTTHPSTNATGQRISWTSDTASGRIRIVLHEGATSRTLLSTQGPGQYTYGLSAVFWSTDGKWIAADDRRILVITPADGRVRVLVMPADSGFGGELARFAITSRDLLTPTN